MIGKEVGAYRILEKIGQGAMGVVYKGIHIQLEQEVAIKVLASTYAAEPSMRQRFIQEAKIQARLTHPHVVNILNYLEDGEDIFLVMEYVRGDTLEQRLKNVGSLAPYAAIDICQSVLSALDFMHIKGVIHRDIKPGNIMFTDTGLVKVTDFGIAKVTGEDGQTKTGMLLGTLGYMSPEQIQGNAASAASDLYALGITLYRMVTGKLPFDGDSEYTIMQGHIETIPTPPWVINPRIPQNLGRVILQALEKVPEHRYQNAQAFTAALTSLTHPRNGLQGDLASALQQPALLSRLLRLSPRRYVLLSSCAITLAAILYAAISGNPLSFKRAQPTAVQPVPTTSTDSAPASMSQSVRSSAEQAPLRAPTVGGEADSAVPVPPPASVGQEGMAAQEPASAQDGQESTASHVGVTTVPPSVAEPYTPSPPIPGDVSTMPHRHAVHTEITPERELSPPTDPGEQATSPPPSVRDNGQPPAPDKAKSSQQRSALPAKKATRDSGGWYIKK